MTSFSKSSEWQVTNAVNGLLSSILPGATKITSNNKNRNSNAKSSNGSKAQLIDQNLKKNIELKEKNTYRIKKKSKELKKRKIKANKVSNEKLEQVAKLQILQKHKEEGTLTNKEKKYFNNLISRNVQKAKSWEFEEDEQDELDEIQQYILGNMDNSKDLKRTKRRRTKKKEFKEEANASDKQSNPDQRYPGLTPGLAPVGLSDEEDSSDED